MKKKKSVYPATFEYMTKKDLAMYCRKGYTGPHWLISPMEPFEDFYKRFKHWKRYTKPKDRYNL